MLAEVDVGSSCDTGEANEAWCGERAEKSEREGVGALQRRRCVLCRKREAAGLFLDEKARPRACTGRFRARKESWVSEGVVTWGAVILGGKNELVVSGKTSFVG